MRNEHVAGMLETTENEPMTHRLLIVDDNAAFLDAAQRLLEREGVTVTGVASTSRDAVRLAEELRPDVVLVDIDLGEESGFDVARQLASMASVVLISAYAEAEFADLIAASPAIGFVSKSALSAAAVTRVLERADDGGAAH